MAAKQRLGLVEGEGATKQAARDAGRIAGNTRRNELMVQPEYKAYSGWEVKELSTSRSNLEIRKADDSNKYESYWGVFAFAPERSKTASAHASRADGVRSL